MSKCRLCNNDSHCGEIIKEEQCCGEQIVIICRNCKCEKCEHEDPLSQS